MSMTPIRQQQLLDALEKYPAFFIGDLADNRTEYVALHRAAQTLESRGKLVTWKQYAGGTNSMWVARPGYDCELLDVPRINGREPKKGDTLRWGLGSVDREF
jgi:hypothetical protein